MTKNIPLLDDIGFDANDYGMRGNALLGIKESGKTYAATLLGERLFDAGIPFTTVDPIGVWKNMRRPGKGKGYPIVVAGIGEGDLKLTPDNAQDIVRAAMQNGISLVLDLYSMNVSKADWRRIMLATLRVLLYENRPHGLRHIFIEEAAEYIPQRPTDGIVYAEVEKLCRMGGNAGLGYTLINQRPQELAKSALELCENLFLFRQKGHHTINYLEKWVGQADKERAKEISQSFLQLPSGQCWAWLAGTNSPQRVRIPEKNSIHPDRRMMRGDIKSAPKQVDVGGFIKGMQEAIKKAAEAKAAAEASEQAAPAKKKLVPEPEAKRAYINTEQGTYEDMVSKAEHKRLLGEEYRRGDADGFKRGYESACAKFDALMTAIGLAVVRAKEAGGPVRAAIEAIDNLAKITGEIEDGSHVIELPLSPPAGTKIDVKGAAIIKEKQVRQINGAPGAALKMLATLDTKPIRSLPWPELALRSGIIPSGGNFNTARKYLVDNKLIVEENGEVQIAKQSKDAPDRPDDWPTLHQKLSGAASKMLSAFDTNPPQWLSWPMAAAMAGIQPRGGNFNTGRKELIDYGLVVNGPEGRAQIRTPSEHATKPVKDRDQLIEHWKNILSPTAAKLLGIVQDFGEIKKDALASRAKMKPKGGHWNTAIKELVDNRLVHKDGDAFKMSEQIG